MFSFNVAADDSIQTDNFRYGSPTSSNPYFAPRDSFTELIPYVCPKLYIVFLFSLSPTLLFVRPAFSFVISGRPAAVAKNNCGDDADGTKTNLSIRPLHSSGSSLGWISADLSLLERDSLARIEGAVT